MEALKNDHQQKQSKLPMIIAVRGLSIDEKSEIASKLAERFQCPLIVEEDILQTLFDDEDIILNYQNFLPNFSSESAFSAVFNVLPFRILTEVSQNQLQSKHQVVISAPLFKRAHFDELLQLANSKEKCLVIVECKTQSNDDDGYDYEIGDVPKLSIDTTKPFVVDDIVPEIINIAKSHMLKLAQRNSQSEESSDKGKKIITPQRCFTEAHAHEFGFKEIEMGSDKLCCKCEESISGPTYKCVVCDDFILHESCAQSEGKFDLSLVNRSLFYRESSPSAYEFPEENKCKLCEHYTSECNDCLLRSHIKWGVLPAIYNYEKHPHPLSFVIMPFWFNYEYKCIACERYGKCVSYKCYNCYLDLHPFCASKSLRCKALGPWGPASRGEHWDDGVFSTVRKLKLYMRADTDAIQIEYDKNGMSIWSNLHGAIFAGAVKHEIELDYPDEYLTSIQGSHNSVWITSLTFTSNKRKYGPYGEIENYHSLFSSPLTGNKIVGFHGNFRGSYLYNIGVYIEPIQQSQF